MRGRVQYVGSIKGWDSPVYAALAGALAELDEDYTPKSPPLLPQPQQARVFTEGKTDPDHLQAASRYFASRGEFPALTFELSDKYGLDGDDRLLSHCKTLSRSPQRNPCVCLFDRDNPKVLRDALNNQPWENWGNGVVAVGLHLLRGEGQTTHLH